MASRPISRISLRTRFPARRTLPSIYLGKDATETKVKEINLKSARVIAFSTHGLISGDIKHLAEPALVLTPPDKATEADDGLLTASEIARLKLNAEWVILSACNTAHAESAGAEGLNAFGSTASTRPRPSRHANVRARPGYAERRRPRYCANSSLAQTSPAPNVTRIAMAALSPSAMPTAST
ncbi:MAG: CHAT domain-containing protein [Rhodospirillaceae bacterium]|nr:CHAT domain-containing protein [Rhodospirillaceae bacterium]